MKRTKCQIILEFSDRELANDMWRKLIKEQIGFDIKTAEVNEPLYPVALVHFDKTSRRYTYLLTDELADKIKKGEASLSRNWPTQYGLSYGESEPIQWLTKSEVNNLYPFERITTIQK